MLATSPTACSPEVDAVPAAASVTVWLAAMVLLFETATVTVDADPSSISAGCADIVHAAVSLSVTDTDTEVVVPSV